MLTNILTSLRMHGALDKLPYAREHIHEREAFAASILEAEREERQIQSISRRLRYAKFPQKKEWSELDYSFNKDIPLQRLENLLQGHFVEAKQNLCLIGQQGTGKTHCLIAIGREICRKGHNVLFTTASALVISLEEAKTAGNVSSLMTKLTKPALLIIDELGFVPYGPTGTQLLFDVFAKRYEQGSIAVSTNLTFDKWTQIFGSIDLTAALLDRFTQAATVIPFVGASFRQHKRPTTNKDTAKETTTTQPQEKMKTTT